MKLPSFVELEGHDAYALLGLSPDATDAEVVAAYRRAIRGAHPDLGGDEDGARLINAAANVLRRRRREYDEQRLRSQRGAFGAGQHSAENVGASAVHNPWENHFASADPWDEDAGFADPWDEVPVVESPTPRREPPRQPPQHGGWGTQTFPTGGWPANEPAPAHPGDAWQATPGYPYETPARRPPARRHFGWWVAATVAALAVPFWLSTCAGLTDRLLHRPGSEASAPPPAGTGSMLVTADAHKGPAADYPVVVKVAAYEKVAIRCTANNRPPPGGASRLWNYTDKGWIADEYVGTGTSEPTAPACQGSVRAPVPASYLPDERRGPFPVRTAAGNGVWAHSEVSPNSPAVRFLADGDLVRVKCWSLGPAMPDEGGPNTRWDMLSAPVVAVVPDALILTIPGVTPSKCQDSY